jgi:two-component system, sporulation sensor kinase E
VVRMSKELEKNSKEYLTELADRYIRILSQGTLNGMLHSLVELIKDFTGSERVILYVYEKDHSQLRMMCSNSENDEKPLKIKIKAENIQEELEKYSCEGEKAVPLYINDDELLGVVFMQNGEIPGENFLSRIALVLKACLNTEARRSAIYKLSTLERLDSMLNSMPMNFDTLYQKVLDFVVKMLNAEKGTIWLVGKDEFVLSYMVGMSEDEILRRRIDLDHGMVGWVAQHNSPILSISSKSDPRVSDDVFNFKIKSAIGVPLMQNGELIGVMMLFNRKNTDFYRTYRHFDEFDLSILAGVATRMMLSRSRIELYLKLRRENETLKRLQKQSKEYIVHQREQVRLLNALQKIMKAMKNSQDVRNVYKIMLIGLTSGMGFGFNRALFLEKDEENKILQVKEWLGPASADEVSDNWKAARQRESMYADFSQYLREEALIIQENEGLTRLAKGKTFSYTGDYIFDRVINRGKIVHVTKILSRERGREFIDLLNFLQVDEFVCVPLMGRREVYGAIILDNKYTAKPITDDMIEMLKIFSESVGLTIESIKSYVELKEKTANLEKQKMVVEYFKDFAQNVLENLDVGIVVVDRENKILEWNKKSEELFNVSKENVINSTINILGPQFFDIFSVAEKVYAVKETISLNEYKLSVEDKDMFLNIKFSPLFEKETNIIIGYIAMFDDVTKEHMMEMELRTQERLAVLGEMSARVAHEIRNPLSAIGGFAQRAKKIAENEKMQKYLDIILNETKRLENLVNQTLEFSRSNLNSSFEERPINEIINEAMELYSDKIKEKSISIEFELSAGEVKAMVEANHFKEVIMNLIQNAIEAVNEGSGKIKIKTQESEDEIIIEVWNNGLPIPPDKLEKIFQPFYTTKTHGTGLGLPICKKIIEDEHKGKIKAMSDENGTTFIIKIPKGLKVEGG